MFNLNSTLLSVIDLTILGLAIYFHIENYLYFICLNGKNVTGLKWEKKNYYSL